MRAWLGAVLVLGLALAGCKRPPSAQQPAPPTPAYDLGQGWTQIDRDYWDVTTQGSRLIPVAWARALQTAQGENFFDPAHMQKFGYLAPQAPSAAVWSVGFAEDVQDDSRFERTKLRWYDGQPANEPWLGMTCAACHTGKIAYQGKTQRIDGGPALADYQGFIESFVAALRATEADKARWNGFAAAVLAGKDTPENRTRLAAAFAKLLAFEDRSLAMNETPLRYGYGRLDAFGHILNRVAQLADAKAEGRPSDGPVSYPFIWNTSQSDRVQWNGIARNKPIAGPAGEFDYGALGRNVGEVTGVFADIVMTPKAGVGGFHSSVNIVNLDRLERQLGLLRPPAWPVELFGPIDAPRAERGQALFATRCASCHMPLARDDLVTKFKAQMSLFSSKDPKNPPPGTDIWMACNAYTHSTASGVLAGTPRGLLSGAPMEETEPTVNLLRVSVVGVIAGQRGDVAQAALESWFGMDNPARIIRPASTITVIDERERRRRLCETATPRTPGDPNDLANTLGYKARPLTGIWATAPYLHNGSVPTLYDLLLPPAQRETRFVVGGRDYDPVRVGYPGGAAGVGGFTFETAKDGAAIDGNGNGGHDYNNAGLSDEMRRDLVEYMKTL
jgi:hypothetical protein